MTNTPSSSFQGRLLLGVVFMALVVLCLLLFEDDLETTTALAAEDRERRVPPELCPTFCEARIRQRQRYHLGDWTNTNELVQLVKLAGNGAMEKLRQEYGSKYFDQIFLSRQDGTLRKIFHSKTGLSEQRFRRKLKRKVLQMQLNLMKENETLEGCNCTANLNEEQDEESRDTRRRLKRMSVSGSEKKLFLPKLRNVYAQFVWATGGDSAAAGRGNLMSETYSYYMQEAAKPVFESIGIQFLGWPYAMGKMPQAPEGALCAKEKYGIDPDVISWDAARSEGDQSWRFHLFGSRVGVHPNRPALFGLNLNSKERESMMEEFEHQGLIALTMDEGELQSIFQSLPDMTKLSEEELEKDAGRFSTYLLCDGDIESGTPCQEKKYSTHVCPERRGGASWHPGYRVHALMGNAIALFLIESLINALEELNEDTRSPVKLMKALMREEAEDLRTFEDTATELPTTFQDIGVDSYSTGYDPEELQPRVVWRSPSICRTAYLPSESRYLGLVNNKIRAREHLTDFDRGKNRDEVMTQMKQLPAGSRVADDAPMQLVYSVDEHRQGEKCDEPIDLDFLDHYLVTSREGRRTMRIPSDAELEYFGRDFDPKGLIILCTTDCPKDHCPAGQIKYDGLNSEQYKLFVNGVPVSEVASFDGHMCGFLRHKVGLYFPSDAEGRFTLSLEVVHQEVSDKPGALSYIEISSVIVL